ncbi:hypothetical protein LKMONMHP_1590 [Methylobacterium organophilum]|uniref:Uncharacterized protein n=1 Tax=Methylobacterium organophilum TaxID=410 RepID=A0ABQ4T8F1_METOR|nr:hypothetical protein LKMONMHP_1590 [Methylobacterium organophilum]
MDALALPVFPRLVPPVPTPPARELSTWRFVRAMRINGIGCWPHRPTRRRICAAASWGAPA